MAGEDNGGSPAHPHNRAGQERAADTVAGSAPVSGAHAHAPRPRAARAAAPGREKREVPTTGHSWDGIEEYDNPMPRWWLWTFYATIVWGIGYTLAYPAWPMISGATSGLLGYSSRAELRTDIADWKARNSEIATRLAEADLSSLRPGSPVYEFAVNAGAAVFRANCSQCHGSGAAGGEGFPNLRDDDWLWGGDQESIRYSIAHGIRSNADADTRTGLGPMPAYGRDQMLGETEVAEVVEHVLAISGQEHDAELAKAGAEVFAGTCISCHGETGTGNREYGAPDLTDAIWLFGGTRADITRSVFYGRAGAMPAWGPRLEPADLAAVALYVHQLGGGE